MIGIDRFLSAKSRWRNMLREEPKAWKQEREAILELYIRGRDEEFFYVAPNNPALWSSFFTYVPNYGVKFGLFGFPANPVERLIFWRNVFFYQPNIPWTNTRLYDANIFEAFGEEPYNDLDKNTKQVLLNLSLSQVPIKMPNEQSITMCRYEVTQLLYTSVMGNNPSHSKGLTRPVEEVSLQEVLRFCNKLSKLEGLKPAYELPAKIPMEDEEWDDEVVWNQGANGYRLPTEAEWLYAANADQDFKYAGSDNVDEVAWHHGNSGNQTHPVGQKKANYFGLYDMSGNVMEWVWGGKYAYDRFERWYPMYRGSYFHYDSHMRLDRLNSDARESSFKAHDVGVRLCRNL